MSIYAPTRSTWAGAYRDEIPSRERPPVVRAEPYIGRLHLALPGFEIDWVLRQDQRDMRRFYALDLAGNRHAHHSPREMLREVVLPLVPVYAGRRF
jgi:hypothetical protein